MLFTRPKPWRFHLVGAQVGGLKGQPSRRRLGLGIPGVNKRFSRLPRVKSPGVPVPHGLPLEPHMTAPSANYGPDHPLLLWIHQLWTRQCLGVYFHFQGVLNYHAKFITGYHRKAAPMERLCWTVDRAPDWRSCSWTDSCEAPFQPLHQAMTEAPVLFVPCFYRTGSHTFVLATDASGFGMGGLPHARLT